MDIFVIFRNCCSRMCGALLCCRKKKPKEESRRTSMLSKKQSLAPTIPPPPEVSTITLETITKLISLLSFARTRGQDSTWCL